MIALLGLALADCPAPVTAVDLGLTNTQAVAAFRGADAAGLQLVTGRAREQLPCTQSRLTTSDLGSFFRSQALATFVGRDREATLRWLLASRAAEPTHTLPDSLLTPAHPFRRLYEGLEDEPPLSPKDVGPHRGAVLIDGRRGTTAPTHRPYVLQQLDTDGSVLGTYLVSDGQVPRLVQPVVDPPPPEEPPPSASPSSPVLLGVAVGPGWIPGATNLYGVLEPQLRVPVADHFALDIAVPLAWTHNKAFFFVPAARLGLTATLGGARTGVDLGGALLSGLFDPDGPVGTRLALGGAVVAGVRHDTGPLTLTAHATAGWAGRPMLHGMVGVAVPLGR